MLENYNKFMSLVHNAWQNRGVVYKGTAIDFKNERTNIQFWVDSKKNRFCFKTDTGVGYEFMLLSCDNVACCLLEHFTDINIA